MNKKKLLTLVLALVLIGTVGVGATLAYFTDNATASNTVTMGYVEIEVEEPGFVYENNTITGVTPGQEIVKDPTITVVSGSQNGAYIRVKVEVTEGYEDILNNLYLGEVKFDTVWTLGDGGYYYWADPVAVGADVTVFDKVVIPAAWGNDYADAKFEINITAEAIQADNFKPTVVDSKPAWMDPENKAITAENYVAPVVEQ